MAKPKLQYALGNSASTTLASGVTNTDTAAALTATTNFNAKSGEGMALLDEGSATEELAYSTGLAGSNLTLPLANRGLEGGSAQAHAAGSSVKGIFSVGMWNDLIDVMIDLFDQDTGAIDTTKVVTPTGTQTLTNKTLTTPTLTSPVLNTGVSGTAIVDEDDMVSNSATKIPTQQSVKAYVDASAGAASADGVRLTKSVAQSIGNGSWTAVTWDQESYDVGGMHEGVTNPSRITIQDAGVYVISFGADWAGNTTGERICAFAVNGTREFESIPQTNIVDGRAMMNISFVRKLAQNDYVEVFVFQTSGGALNLNHVTASEVTAQFAAQYLATGT